MGTPIIVAGKWIVMMTDTERGLLTEEQYYRFVKGELSEEEIEAAKREFVEKLSHGLPPATD